MLVQSKHTTQSSGVGEQIYMQISPQDSVKLSLMLSSIYTELYSPIREYISNGVRAHHLAGG